MKALVVYESMYGNTHVIAEAIADGLGETADVRLAPVSEAEAALIDNPELVVMGGPTHAHGMSRAATRQAAVEDAKKPERGLTIEPQADGPGVRDVLRQVGTLDASAAAFDTRIKIPAWIAGRASKGIARELRRRGARLIAKPESFLVTKDNQLVDGEVERARAWGARLSREMGAREAVREARGE